MLLNRTAIAFCALCLCALALPSSAEATLVTNFNFNGLDPLSASSGSGTITIGGGPTTPPVSFEGGTTVNAVAGDEAGNALSIGSNSNNDAWLTLEFSSTGYGDLSLSFAAKGSNATYNSARVEYSINGTDFFDAVPAIVFDPSTQGNWSTTGPIDLTNVTQLNNVATAYLRLVLAGANVPPNQTLSIDNLQITGTAMPEAEAVAMMGVALLLFGGLAYRRWRASIGGQTVPAQLLAA